MGLCCAAIRIPLEFRDDNPASSIIFDELPDLESLMLKARFCSHLPSSSLELVQLFDAGGSAPVLRKNSIAPGLTLWRGCGRVLA